MGQPIQAEAHTPFSAFTRENRSERFSGARYSSDILVNSGLLIGRTVQHGSILVTL